MKTTLDKAGRIVLPKKVRDRLHLKPGAKFKLEVVGEKIEIEQEAPSVKVVRNRHGRRVVVGWESFDAAKAVRQMHEELAQRVSHRVDDRTIEPIALTRDEPARRGGHEAAVERWLKHRLGDERKSEVTGQASIPRVRQIRTRVR